jgi:hypothetical protein
MFGMGMIPWSPVAMGFLTRPHAKFLDSARGTSMNGTFMVKIPLPQTSEVSHI